MKTKLLTLIAGLAGFFAFTSGAQTICPSCWDWIWFKSGNATVVSNMQGLLISSLGASGQDGVSLGLKESSRTATVQYAAVNLNSNNTGMAFEVSGMVNDSPGRFLGKVAFQNNGNGVDLVFDPGSMPVASQLRLEVYNGNTLVGSLVMPASGSLGTISGDVQLTSFFVGQDNPAAGFWWFDWDWLTPVHFSAVNGSGNRLRVVALNPIGPLQNLLQLDMTGRNLGSFLITAASAPQFQPRLRIARNGQNFNLNWDTRSAVLQNSPTVDGPWKRMLEGTNSVVITPGPRQQNYFRVQFDPTAFPEGIFPFPASTRRNVLLVIADDVGVDQVPWYINYFQTNTLAGDEIAVSAPGGNPATVMPVLDKLAAAGVAFVNAWSSPVCSPTRAGLYAGTCSFRHGVYSPLGSTGLGLPIGTTTIPNVMTPAGYTNALVGKWHCGEDTSIYTDPLGPPYQFGWGYHAGSLGGQLANYTNWDKVINGTHSTCTSYATTNNAEDALAWINSQNGRWMATLAFNAPHTPLDVGPPAGCEYTARSAASVPGVAGNKARYRSILECLDRSLGTVLAGMDTNVLANTTIIFLGDNGTERGVTDHFTQANFPSYGTVNHAKDSLYEGGVRVPLVVADGHAYLNGAASPAGGGRGRVVAPGRVESTPVQTMDIFATVAEIGHGDASSGFDSVSLVPYLSNTSGTPVREVVIAETRTNSWVAGTPWVCGDPGWDIAVRGQFFKLIVRNYGSTTAGQLENYELYYLLSDPWETTDLLLDGGMSVVEQEIRDALRAKLEAILTTDGSYTCHP